MSARANLTKALSSVADAAIDAHDAISEHDRDRLTKAMSVLLRNCLEASIEHCELLQEQRS